MGAFWTAGAGKRGKELGIQRTINSHCGWSTLIKRESVKGQVREGLGGHGQGWTSPGKRATGGFEKKKSAIMGFRCKTSLAAD